MHERTPPQDLLNKPKMDAGVVQSLRVVLRVVRTVVRNFYRQLKQKCGVFIGRHQLHRAAAAHP